MSPSAVIDPVHRAGSAILGLGLLTFGVLGFVNRLAFFSTEGDRVLGLSSNGVLSTISVVVGAVLIGAGARGGRTASTVTAAVGVLFLFSGLAHLAVLGTAANLLAFRIPNVIFSLIAGMLLLFLGLYGRVSGGLAPDNPYLRGSRGTSNETQATSRSDDGMVAAELATAEGHATAEQAEAVRADRQRRADEARHRAWQNAAESERHAPDHPDRAATRRIAHDGRDTTDHRTSGEPDVSTDPAVAGSRAIGGPPGRDGTDSTSTTGTGVDQAVGRKPAAD